jgi:hypothetical protein
LGNGGLAAEVAGQQCLDAVIAHADLLFFN